MPKPKGNPSTRLGARVFVGMSGGVDSSVAAALLKKQGYEVIGVHLKCFNVDGCAAQDAEDARRAAEHLSIPFYTFDYEKEYKDKVVEYMIDGYKKGITPNPDVMCNREIKFGLFYNKAMSLGADYIATGHYVRLRKSANGESGTNIRITNSPFVNSKKIRYSLIIAKDKNKDQSYFLWILKPEQLRHCLFPIGEYTKPQVRKLAEKFGLHNAAKKDSQGICFLGQVSLPDFLKKYIKPKKGPIVIANDPSLSLRGAQRRGNLTKNFIQIGTHSGAHFYTIGQRSGLGIGGYKKPLYIAEKDVKKNVIVVAEGEDNPALYKKEVTLANANFFIDVSSLRGAQRRGNLSIPVMARVRYRQPLAKANLYLPYSRELENRKTAILLFDKPQKFVASGQSAVFYRARRSPALRGEGGRFYEMLGGGVIV